MNNDTPQIGEIRKNSDAGKCGSNKYIYHACEKCGKPRWVKLHKGKPRNTWCLICNQERMVSKLRKRPYVSYNNGYKAIKVKRGDFFRTMAREDGYCLEHRLVMAKSLGRCLLSWEVVHHINHIKNDNRIENLQLIGINKHLQITILENKLNKQEQKIKILEFRVTELEKENNYLKNKTEFTPT